MRSGRSHFLFGAVTHNRAEGPQAVRDYGVIGARVTPEDAKPSAIAQT